MLTAPLLTPSAAMSRRAALAAREEQALLSASRLYALRQRINSDSAATGAPTVYVVLYALTDVGVSPREHLAEPQGLAHAHGYVVHARFCDTVGGTRPGWAKAHRTIAEGRAHGIIASSRTAVGGSDQQYEFELHWLARHRAALWLVRPEPALCPPGSPSENSARTVRQARRIAGAAKPSAGIRPHRHAAQWSSRRTT